MKSQRKTILLAVLIGLIAAAASILTSPSIPPACRDFREQMQQLVYGDGGLSGVIAAMPEDLMDKAIAERYGTLSPEQCTAHAESIKGAVEGLDHTVWGAKMGQADDDVKQAMKDCRAKRVSGELKTHADSAQCSNPKITAAFAQIGYPYKDLVDSFTAKRLELAQKLDKEDPNGTEDQMEFAKFALGIAEQEAERVKAKNQQ